jgi:hypothetical protein
MNAKALDGRAHAQQGLGTIGPDERKSASAPFYVAHDRLPSLVGGVGTAAGVELGVSCGGPGTIPGFEMARDRAKPPGHKRCKQPAGLQGVLRLGETG